MNMDKPDDRYRQAMQKLSTLVEKRNELLQELDGMCTRASTSSAEGGKVMAFDVERGRRILKRIGRQNSQLARTISTVNKYAALTDNRLVRWERSDSGADAGSESEAPSTA